MSPFVTEEMRRLAGITESAPDFKRYDRKSLMQESSPELEELLISGVMASLTAEEQEAIDSEADELMSEATVVEPKVRASSGLPTQWLKMKAQRVIALHKKGHKDLAIKHAGDLASELTKHGQHMRAKKVTRYIDRIKASGVEAPKSENTEAEEAAFASLTAEELSVIETELGEALLADPKTRPGAPTQWLDSQLKKHQVLKAAAAKDPKHIKAAMDHADKLAGELEKHGFDTHAKGVRAFHKQAGGLTLPRGGASSRERAEWKTKHDPTVVEFAPVLAAIGRGLAGAAGKVASGAAKTAGKAAGHAVGAAIASKVAPKPEPKPATEATEAPAFGTWKTGGKHKKVKGGKEASIPSGGAKVPAEVK